MHFISGTEASFTTSASSRACADGVFAKSVLAKVSNYRYKVFVETLGWQLNTKNNEEWDQFDRPDTVYVAAEDDDGQVIGCARLLPTHRPYLLGEVFPQLMAGLALPCSADVWELSRFAAVDFNSKNTSALQQFSSPVAIKLLQQSIACAAAQGAKRLITVSPIGIERLLRRAGFRARRAGPPTIVDGHPLFACWIEIDPVEISPERDLLAS